MAAMSGKMKLGKSLNKATGKESNYEIAFSGMNWGGSMEYFLDQIVNSVRESSRQKIVKKALDHYEAAKKKAGKARAMSQIIDIDDPGRGRAMVVDLSDSDEECKPSQLSISGGIPHYLP
jgi:hypothetical protein